MIHLNVGTIIHLSIEAQSIGINKLDDIPETKSGTDGNFDP